MGFCFVNAFKVKFVPNDKMTEKRLSEFLGGKIEIFSKKGRLEIRLAKCQRNDFSPPPKPKARSPPINPLPIASIYT